jgi:putative transposase
MRRAPPGVAWLSAWRTDLVYRDKEWFLFTTVDVPDQEENKVLDWIGIDMGIVSIAETSEGTRFAGATVNGRRVRMFG